MLISDDYRQEQTAAELANDAQMIEVGLCGSNSQLNTGERSHYPDAPS